MSVEGDPCLAKHVFVINPQVNGGESLVLKTEFFHNGDDEDELACGIYARQELTLQSYCNSAKFCLHGANFTPSVLRYLADSLEEAEQRARSLRTNGELIDAESGALHY